MANLPPLLSFYAPLTFETELDKFANSEGTYRMFSNPGKSLTSDAISQLGAYNVGPIPMGMIDAFGEMDEHSASMPRYYKDNKQTWVYSNVLMRSNITEDLRDANNAPIETRITIAATSCNYFDVTGGLITGVSPSLRADLERYFKTVSKYKGKSFEQCLKLLMPGELFGADADKEFVRGSLVTASKGMWTRGSHNNLEIRSFEIGKEIHGLKHAVTGWLELYSNDYDLGRAQIKVSGLPIPYVEVKDGAFNRQTSLDSTSTSGGSPGEAKITSKNSNGMVTGTAPPGSVIVVDFGSQAEVPYHSTITGDKGVWSVVRPAGASDNMIRARIEGGAPSTTSTSSFSEVSEGVVRQVNGLPTLLPALGEYLIGGPPYRYKEDVWEYSADAIGLNLKLNPEHPLAMGKDIGRFTVFGVRHNIQLGLWSQKAGSTFVSYAGGAIQSTGIALFVNEDPLVPEGSIVKYKNRSYTVPKWNIRKIFDLKLGMLDSIVGGETLITSFDKNNPTAFRESYQFTYQKNHEPYVKRFVTSFKKNVEKSPRHLTWKTSWRVTKPKRGKFRLYLQYRKNLPEKLPGRAFYVVRYVSRQAREYNLKFQTSFRSDQARSSNKTLQTSFLVNPVEPVRIVPYYVRRKVGDEWEHFVSYAVFGVSALVQNYILDNKLLFYFSNPTSYEIVKFDYNLLPYTGIFLEQLDYEELKNSSEIPENFSFIGNYSIKNINPSNSLSLDVVGDVKQLNEYRSYWMPEDIFEWDVQDLIPIQGTDEAYYTKITRDFKDNHHEDVVELDLMILNERECCFTQKASGSRCSPY